MTKIQILKNKTTQLETKQVDDNNIFSGIDEIIEPNFSFETLLEVYENSSIISGIIGKIAIKTASKFKKTESKELNNVLENLDFESLVLDILIFGNTYFERLKNKLGEKTLEFSHIIAPTVRVASKKSGFSFFQKSNKEINEVGFYEDEILSLKRNSVSSKYYGDSIFASSIDEIILLSYITQYFKKFFKNGNINPTILFSEEDLEEEQIEKIQSLIGDTISGVENSSQTIYIGGKIGKIDLSTIFDPEKYISLKRELKEDIAIDLNIPFDLLSSENSNRATSQTAMEVLYSNIIIPLQQRIEKQIKNQFRKWFLAEKGEKCWVGIREEDIEMIEFEDINLKNPKEEMETLTGYQKNGVLSVNEVRKIAGLGEDIEGGDEYKVITGNSEKNENKEEEMEKIRENLKKIYG